jgi:uncharacterized protein
MTLPRPAVLAVVILVALSSSPRAQTPAASSANVISVSGDAEVRVVPDEVVLSLGVETFDQVLKSAKDLNDDRIKKTIAAARNHGVAAEQIQTDYIAIEPRYPDGDVTRQLLGYVVRKSVIVRLKNITRFEDLLSATLEAGVTHVHGIEFRATELRKYRDQARVLALKAAQEKADLLVREAGRRLGQTLTIGEASYGYLSSYGAWWGSRYGSMSAQNAVQNMGGSGIGNDSTLAPGQIAIRANVNVSFVMN